MKIGILVLIHTAITAIVYGAPPPYTPPFIEKVTVVTAEEAWEFVKKGVLIIDARVAHEYVEERIKGAVSIPYKEKSKKGVDYDSSLDRFDLSKLPKIKSTPVIFYCNGRKCWKSFKASSAAVAAGYTRVYWLRGGIPEWKTKNFPVE